MRSFRTKLGVLIPLASGLTALSAVAQEPTSPEAPADQPPPAIPSADPTAEDVRRLSRKLAELEARLAARERADAERENAEREKAARQPAIAKKEEPLPAAWSPFPGDYSWAPGSYAAGEHPLTLGDGIFTGEFRIDVGYHHSFRDPIDNTISGSSEVFRSGEVQVTQIGIGGDFNYKNVQGRLMTQFGMYSTGTPRNDASPARGQWQLDNAYRYISEAYGGYHIDAGKAGHVNIQAGLFMSYVGLWSYYNFDNWTYQPSYVSSNTPWYFNGIRIQWFPTPNLKIEPWLVNGWQAYGKFNQAPGGGIQIRWNHDEWFSIAVNQYFGTDTLGIRGRKRLHSDDSVMARYYHHPGGALSKAAASLTVDAGCEIGTEGDVTCGEQYFLGFMAYNRLWFAGDKIGLTLGGGAITNPGRYLVLMPPINGATGFSGTPYFSYNRGDTYQAWDMQATVDFMPSPFYTFRTEFNHRAANIPYFTGHGGVTPPGGNQGSPGSAIDGWAPDLVNDENRITAAFLLKL